MYKSIVDAVIHHSKEEPDKIAIADAEQCFTYAQLVKEISKTAQWLESKDVQPGDYVLVECTQDTKYLIIFLALEYLGIIFVPIERDSVQERVGAIVNETKAKFMIGVNDYKDVITEFSYSQYLEEKELFEEKELCYIPKESVLEVLFTTGTTGKSKGVVCSVNSNIACVENIIEGIHMSENAVEIVTLPMSHARSLNTCCANLYHGSTVVMIDGIMNVALFFQLIEKYRVTALNISPTIANVLFRVAKKGLQKISDQIEYLTIGTASVEDDVKEKLRELFPNTRLYNSYGATEAPRTCFLNFQEFDQPKCIGYPTKHAKFLVVDENKNIIKSSKDNLGYIAVSGEMMMDGYLNEEELTKQTLINGILYTQDLGYIDEEGRVYIIGRAGDVINYKGIKIAPDEIESVASKYDGITDCACVGKEDKLCGQVPILFVTVEKEIDKNDFMNYLKQNLEQMRVPYSIEIIDEMPRTSNGKLLRRKLREM